MVYGNKVRKSIMKKNPDMSITDVMREIASMWKTLTEDERAPHIAKADKLKSKYEKELQKYKKSSGYAEYCEEKAEYQAKMAAKRRAMDPSESSARKVKKPRRSRSLTHSRTPSRR